MDKNVASKGQVVYFSHGGGPLPILGDPGHSAMVDFMVNLPKQLAKPEAILVISAHWEERVATLTGAANPPLFYDYYGFPEESYALTYPAPGQPALAERIAALLTQNEIPVRTDTKRGFDHGLFIPLKLMYPEATIPCVQLSLVAGLDPQMHLALGKALQPLLQENILVIGSGFSFHNLRAFFNQPQPSVDPINDAFQNWLIETCTGPITLPERERLLTDWEQVPSSRYCHPREEHLLPVHVCSAMAGTPGRVVFDDSILGKRSVAFLWK